MPLPEPGAALYPSSLSLQSPEELGLWHLGQRWEAQAEGTNMSITICL